jgi:hypothetical protein
MESGMKQILSSITLLACVACLCSVPSAWAQSVGGSCSTNGLTFTIGTNPTQTLVCNSSTWALAEQINANSDIGINQSSPQAQLDVNGGVKVNGNDITNSCSGTNAGDVNYTSAATSTACTGGSSAGLCYCNGSSWVLLSNATSTASGCGQSGTVSGPQDVFLTVPAGCTVAFYAWGGGGGGGAYSTYSTYGGAGGGGGSASVSLGSTSSAVIYFLAAGGGGGGAGATVNPAAGGESVVNYSGGNGYSTASGAGGGASGVWIGDTGGTALIIAGGGGGGQSGGNGTVGVSGGAGGGTGSGGAGSTQGTIGANANPPTAGGGGGDNGGAVTEGGANYVATTVSGYTVTGYGTMAGAYQSAGNNGYVNYPSGAGQGGAGGSFGTPGGNGTAGAIYWQTN